MVCVNVEGVGDEKVGKRLGSAHGKKPRIGPELDEIAEGDMDIGLEPINSRNRVEDLERLKGLYV